MTRDLDPDHYGYMLALEQKLGRPFAGIRQNTALPTPPMIPAQTRWAYDGGRHWTYQNGGPKPIDEVVLQWASVAAGRYDSVFLDYFRLIRDSGMWTTEHPHRYSFHHEQFVLAENGGARAGTAADYKAAHRRVYMLLKRSGAHVSEGGNMRFAFVPHWRQLASDPTFGSGVESDPGATAYSVTNIDPGAAYYDDCGADIYVSETDPPYSAAEQWEPLHRWASTRGKPFMTGETGYAGPDLAGYLDELMSLLRSWGAGEAAGRCEAVLWTSRIAEGGDYRLDRSDAVLAEYRALANDPLFQGS
jgi:hypothetical protein